MTHDVLWVMDGEPQQAVALPQLTREGIEPGSEPGVRQIGGRFVDIDRAPDAAADLFPDAEELVGRGGGADSLHVIRQDLRIINADHARIEPDQVLVTVERPAERTATAPALQSGAGGVVAVIEEHAQAAEPAQGGRAAQQKGDSSIDALDLISGRRALAIGHDEALDDLRQPGARLRRVVQRFQWGHAAALAALDADIVATSGQYAQFV